MARRLSHDDLARVRIKLRLAEYVDAEIIEKLCDEIDNVRADWQLDRMMYGEALDTARRELEDLKEAQAKKKRVVKRD